MSCKILLICLFIMLTGLEFGEARTFKVEEAMFGPEHAKSFPDRVPPPWTNVVQGTFGSQVGKPQFSFDFGGNGRDSSNWGAGVNAGAGLKVWESQNQRHSVGAGFNFQQGFGRSQGHFGRSLPNVGAGVGYRFGFGK